MGSTTIRVAAVEDAPAMGEIHVRAWRAAYRGIMPGDYLDELRAEDRSDLWRRVIEAGRPAARRVVIESSGEVVGFAAYGVERGTIGDPAVGELYAINIDPENWRKGFGRVMLRHVTTELSDLGFSAAVLWVVSENARARRFYELAGWQPDGTERVDTLQGVTVNEVRYVRTLPA